jgi:hypothetical protein
MGEGEGVREGEGEGPRGREREGEGARESKPVMVEMCGELLGVWDRIWRFYDDEGAEGYSGRTR